MTAVLVDVVLALLAFILAIVLLTCLAVLVAGIGSMADDARSRRRMRHSLNELLREKP